MQVPKAGQISKVLVWKDGQIFKPLSIKEGIMDQSLWQVALAQGVDMDL